MAMEYYGIGYFPFQANFFECNTLELIQAKYGVKGPYLVMQLLCKIYREGYYICWGAEEQEIFAYKIRHELLAEEVNGIVGMLIEKGFFCKRSYEEYHILTSIEIQQIWIEATSRRKRDLAKLPYLLITDFGGKRSRGGEAPDCLPAPNCIHDVSLSPENAYNFRQSKVDKIKELPPSIPPRESDELAVGSFSPAPPAYALNTRTHNYVGLLDSLERLHVTAPDEIKAILSLSDFGRKGTPVWKLLNSTNWTKVSSKGKYLLASLKKGSP